MADFSTNYTPAGITTTTSAPPLGAMPGLDPHLSDIANQVIQMKLDKQKREEAAAVAAESEARKAHYDELRRTTGDNAPSAGYQAFLNSGGIKHGSTGAVLGSSSAGGMPGTVQQQMQQLALRDAQNQIQSKERAAPVRMIQGPGIVPGYTTDVDAMNGYQRQDYLPNGSTQVGRF